MSGVTNGGLPVLELVLGIVFGEPPVDLDRSIVPTARRQSLHEGTPFTHPGTR